jgi:putative endonuclease
MNFYVYVLRDNKNKLYKGVTNNITRRLKEHRSGKTRTTSNMEDINVVYTEIYDNFPEARKRELYLKTAAGRRFLKEKICHLNSVGRVPLS